MGGAVEPVRNASPFGSPSASPTSAALATAVRRLTDQASSGKQCSSVPTIGGHGAQDSEGDALLLRISTEMVRAQKRFFGKGPPQAKSYFLDDTLIVVTRAG